MLLLYISDLTSSSTSELLVSALGIEPEVACTNKMLIMLLNEYDAKVHN